MDEKELKRINELWELLWYIHANRSLTETWMNHNDEKSFKLPMTTRYDETRYQNWVDIFQNIISLLIKKILFYYPPEEYNYNAGENFSYLSVLKSENRHLNTHLEELIAQFQITNNANSS